MRDYLNSALGQVDESGKLRDPFDAHNVRRPAQEGAADVGDVHAVPFVLECKNVKRPSVPTFVRQGEIEAVHAGFPFGVAVVKIPRKNVRRGSVHFGVRTWTRVRRSLEMGTREFADRYLFLPSLRGLDTGRWYMTTDLEAFARLLKDVRDRRHAP
ncbi:hypothetical protein [Streptomyces alkaliterrae]|uniref:Holliday junction resolvase n=1 Tax=Streptomyces alkaliterrae TaxID=2213162 RepID=A0A5P0YIU8_9ACTN|nr:hypothetical protein [Streptomyces alkaliterrae]MBB1251859.1 hypothetical protein [Streptomyces alkaliterrae]MBB1259318.1 hypothetical protein [Streptomyces alkaliterrae]MQS00303.1 hypothetical protein [Streptomyces alkaliterrae]